MFHSTHSNSFWLPLNSEWSLRKDVSLRQKSVEELVCLLLVFLLYQFYLIVQTNNVVYVTAGFVVSLQGFEVG